MSSTLPSILIVPGFWESGTGVFDELSQRLQSTGHQVIVAELASTGHASRSTPSLAEDISKIRAYVESQISLDAKIVILAHSAGGFIGSAAIEGLTTTVDSKDAGVIGIAFLCAGVFPAGYETGAMPFFDIKGEYLYCTSPRSSLFNDLDDKTAEIWEMRLQPQPAANWDGTIPFAGFEHVPSHYLVCRNDQLLPVELQVQMASVAKAQVSYCDAGHMAMISQPEAVADFVCQCVRRLLGPKSS